MENKWKLQDIEKEVHAQIEIALKRIPHISHLSTHMGCLSFSDETRQLYKRLAKEYGLYVSSDENDKVTAFPRWIGIDVDKSQKLKNLLKNIESLGPGTYLLVEHPAFDDLETQGMRHVGYGNVAQDRSGVTYALTHESVIAIIKARKVQLISYKNLK